MKGQTFAQVAMTAALRGTVIEQIALRRLVLRLGRLRWSLRLGCDGLWHLNA